MAIRRSHAAWCARHGVIADDVTSEVTRMHAEHTSEAFGVVVLCLGVVTDSEGGTFCAALRKIRKNL